MKKIILNFIVLFPIGYSANAQVTLDLTYLGPTSSQDLHYRLANSTDTLITHLPSAAKAALYNLAIFENGYFRGFSASNQYISYLYSTNFAAVWSAVMNMQVIVGSHVNINYSVALHGANSTYPIATCSFCANCYFPPGGDLGDCCRIGEGGCCDYRSPTGGGNY